MSTALPSTPTKRGLIPIYGTLAAVAIGLVVTVSYMLDHHADQHQPPYAPTTAPWRPFSPLSTPTPPPFWQPGPPADLITMLRRGFSPSYDWNEVIKPTHQPVPAWAQQIAAQDLCKVILTDYHPYKYGSTQNNPAQQTIVNCEAEQLVTEVGALFTDKTLVRRTAEFALAQQANALYQEEQDPYQKPHLAIEQLCKMSLPHKGSAIFGSKAQGDRPNAH